MGSQWSWRRSSLELAPARAHSCGAVLYMLKCKMWRLHGLPRLPCVPTYLRLIQTPSICDQHSQKCILHVLFFVVLFCLCFFLCWVFFSSSLTIFLTAVLGFVYGVYQPEVCLACAINHWTVFLSSFRSANSGKQWPVWGALHGLGR